jgi:hypothetical protein
MRRKNWEAIVSIAIVSFLLLAALLAGYLV